MGKPSWVALSQCSSVLVQVLKIDVLLYVAVNAFSPALHKFIAGSLLVCELVAVPSQSYFWKFSEACIGYRMLHVVCGLYVKSYAHKVPLRCTFLGKT